jgi:hypothetical protein
MSSLLIDYYNVIDTKNHNLLLDKIKVKIIPKKSKYKLGLILFISNKEFDIFDNLNNGDEKIKYLNDENFIKSIEDFTYILHDYKICEILYPVKKIKLCISTIEYYLHDVEHIKITLHIKDVNIILEHANFFFGKPYIKDSKMYITRTKNDTNIYYNNIKYILKEFNKKNNHCTILAKIGEDTLKTFKEYSECGGFTKNKNGTTTQKEIAGNMVVSYVDKQLIHILDINKDSIIYGTDCGVDIVDGLYNFHSHPKDTYKKFNVKLGFPSAQDYIGFLIGYIEDNTIIHFVVTLEGIYIISISIELLDRNKKFNIDVICKFIENNYKINATDTEKYNVTQYINYIKNIKYKKYRLFDINFLDWNEQNKILKIPYNKINNNCISCQKTKDLYEKNLI